MPFTDTDAVNYGWLALCAEDMYANAEGSLAPAPDARLDALRWDVVAYLTAMDALVPTPNAQSRTLSFDAGKRVFFGFVARSRDDPSLFAIALRGTDGMVEWVIDAEFAPIPHPAYPGAHVEQGFFGLYQTLSLADFPTGTTTHQDATEGVAALIGGGRAVVTGHSLGSALATYFAQALAVRAPGRVSACLFASPRTGDAAWVGLFDAAVADYRLINYSLDAVPHVPVGIGYATLTKTTVLQPSSARAGVKLDLFCNHHLVDYCAMLDFAREQSQPLDKADAGSVTCILGPANTVPETAKALALLVDAFGLATQQTLLLLKGLHLANLA